MTGRIRSALAVLLLAVTLSAAAPPATAAAAPLVRPNIVLVLTDDQTMESVARMPYVTSRTDWISFDRAHINNALCCPSRATILTGRYDTHTRVGTNTQGSLLDETSTLPVWLRQAGYQTGMFGKYLNGYPFGRGLYIPPGWSQWQVPYHGGSQWGIYDQYTYKLNNNGVSESYLSAASDYQPTVLTRKLNTWIRARAAAGTPFFAMYTPVATHGPWTASPARRNFYATTPVPASPTFNFAAPDQPAYLRAQAPLDLATQNAHRRREWAAALSVDDTIRTIDDTLRAAGVYDNTIVIFMTDNGYAFGNHRWERKRCEFNDCSQTPMLVRYPGLPGRHDGTHLISNADMAATVAELAGAVPGAPQDGMSFAPLILGEEPAAWRTGLLLHWPGGDMNGAAGRPDSMPQFWGVLGYAAAGDLFKYVELDTGERELYDEAADPLEMTNRAGEAAFVGVEAEMAAQLAVLKAGAVGTAGALRVRADVPVPGALGPDLG